MGTPPNPSTHSISAAMATVGTRCTRHLAGMPCMTGFRASCCFVSKELTAMLRWKTQPSQIHLESFLSRTLHLVPSGSSWEERPQGNVNSSHTFPQCIRVMTGPPVTWVPGSILVDRNARGSCWPPNSLGAGELLPCSTGTPCCTLHSKVPAKSSSLWVLSGALY